MPVRLHPGWVIREYAVDKLDLLRQFKLYLAASPAQ